MEHSRGMLLEKSSAAGFNNLGGRKGVKCRFCNLHIRRWKDCSDLIVKHLKKSPNCTLARDLETTVYMDVD